MYQIDEQYRSIPTKNLKGVSQKTADKLYKLALFNIHDLLFNLPFRYEDKTRLLQIAEAPLDSGPCLIQGTVSGAQQVNARLFIVTINDNSGRAQLKFFNMPSYYTRKYVKGVTVQAYGVLKPDSFSHIPGMFMPQVSFLNQKQKGMHESTLTPIYHLTDGLSQHAMRTIEGEALKLLAAQPLPELMPESLRLGKLTLSKALEICHHPAPSTNGYLPTPDEIPAYQYLAYEELTSYLTSLIFMKARQTEKEAPVIKCSTKVQEEFLQALPFTPTSAQSRTMAEIFTDIESKVPMIRLVNGDVGSGKTLIAFAAALHAARNGYQSVLLAPTEILARQHYEKCSVLMEKLGVQCAFLSSKLQKSERTELQNRIKDGSVQIIIGTHAVFQPRMEYAALALVIVDEQHRFGVEQRTKLLKKGISGLTPHQLTLTATPIPRTLQLALYSDFAVSKLDERPAGRQEIITATMRSSNRPAIVERVRQNIMQGRQAYWVCPLIDESEDFTASSVKELYDLLQNLLPQCSIGLLHGQMSSDDKNKIMAAFADGSINILVATTIVEVGMDVPNASLMLIESAQRLGLAQLHQLRGRVGRGSVQSYCLLIYDDDELTEVAVKRLEIMKQTNNGFEIAMMDLTLRGPGDATGIRQAGFNSFKFADVARDLPLLENAKKAAQELCRNEPEKAELLVKRWSPDFFDKEPNEEVQTAQRAAPKRVRRTAAAIETQGGLS